MVDYQSHEFYFIKVGLLEFQVQWQMIFKGVMLENISLFSERMLYAALMSFQMWAVSTEILAVI